MQHTLTDWLNASKKLTDEHPTLRQAMVYALDHVAKTAAENGGTTDLADPITATATDILHNLVPVSDPKACLTCGAPQIGVSIFCGHCLSAYGTNRWDWPPWVKRLAEAKYPGSTP